MGTIPDLTAVRAYVRVPASNLSDEDLERMRLAALADQDARCIYPGQGEAPPIIDVDGMIATATVTGGAPGLHYRLSWGDGQNGDVTADANGDATAEHTYQNPGTYT